MLINNLFPIFKVFLGCLIPSTSQLASIGVPERSKLQERDPSLLALSIPTTNSWFPLLPVSASTHKTATLLQQKENIKVCFLFHSSMYFFSLQISIFF